MCAQVTDKCIDNQRQLRGSLCDEWTGRCTRTSVYGGGLLYKPGLVGLVRVLVWKVACFGTQAVFMSLGQAAVSGLFTKRQVLVNVSPGPGFMERLVDAVSKNIWSLYQSM